MTYIMLPFLVHAVARAMRSLDPTTLRAACALRRERWQIFCRMLVPLLCSGIGAGVLMVFVMALGYFVTPSLLGGPPYMMLAELIAQLVQQLPNWGLAGAAALVLLVVTLALFALQLRFFGFAPAHEAESLTCCSISIASAPFAVSLLAVGAAVSLSCCCRSCSLSPCRSAIRAGLQFPPAALDDQWYSQLFADPGWLVSLLTSVELAPWSLWSLP